MEEISHLPRLHIAGCGDIGRRVAALCSKNGFTVRATVRSKASLVACQTAGITANCEDLQHSAHWLTTYLDGQRPYGLFYFAPPAASGQGDCVMQAQLHYIKSAAPQKIVLISTTGVYGDAQGGWIDETAALNPASDRARRRVDAEQQLRRFCAAAGIKYMILRAPGIYAKNRLPLKRLQSGAAVVAAQQAPWSNRIHADDLAMACMLAMTGDCSNEIINVCDDEPSSMTAYFNAVADFSGIQRPPQVALEDKLKTCSEAMRSYLTESRRIKNDKMKSLLGLQLKYPDLAAGLSA